MLNVTFHKLALGRAQNLVARELRCRVHKGHHILQLVSESVGSA